ncbi:MAG: Ig-like domain-containing protein, partial [Tannerella sp.]|nr:Ig-like domain-containing protein [Tannerella sp.]
MLHQSFFSKTVVAGAAIALFLLAGCGDDEEKKVALSSIEVTPASVTLTVGDAPQQLTATPAPKDAADVAFKWSSADDAVATVSETGLVTAVKAGNTTVKVASGKIEKSVTVTVLASANPDAVEIDQVVSYAGIGRAYFEITVSNTAIDKVRIYWNNRQGSQEVPIGGQPSGVYTATVEELAGGSYEFTLVPVNSAQQESTSVKTTTATVYSAASLAETCSARSVAKVYYYGAANISIYWAPVEATEVK